MKAPCHDIRICAVEDREAAEGAEEGVAGDEIDETLE